MSIGWPICSGEVWLGAFEVVSSHWKEMQLLMCSSFGKGIFNRLPSRKCWIGPNKRSSHSSHPFSEHASNVIPSSWNTPSHALTSVPGWFLLSFQFPDSKTLFPLRLSLKALGLGKTQSPRSGSYHYPTRLASAHPHTVKLVAETRLWWSEVQHLLQVLRVSLWLSW